MADSPQHGLEALFEDALGVATGRGEPEWLLAARQGAFERFRTNGFPTTRLEAWKYTNLKPVAEGHYVLPPTREQALPASAIPAVRDDELRVVFLNGVLSTEHSALGTFEGGTVSPLFDALSNGEGDALRELMTASPAGDDEVFADLNTAFLSNGVVIRIRENAKPAQRLHVLSLQTVGDANIITAPRVVIHAGKGSEATVVQSSIGPTLAPGFTCAVTDIHVEDGAHLFFGKIQSEGREAFHFSRVHSRQGRDSTLALFDFAMGAKLARNNVVARMEGEGGDLTMNGAYAVRMRQHVDNHTVVDHAVPHCSSRQTYKGILNDHARAVFDGRIVVRIGAQQTDALQMNKNLLLSKTARVDTKPQLEISNDDVKCTHGATIGQLKNDELFYLQSRGIPPQEAAAMLSRGFLEEVLYSIEDVVVRDSLRDVLSAYFMEPGSAS